MNKFLALNQPVANGRAWTQPVKLTTLGKCKIGLIILTMLIGLLLSGLMAAPGHSSFAVESPYKSLPPNALGQTQTWKKGSNKALTQTIRVSIPKTLIKSKIYPVVIMFTGLGSILPTAAYDTLMKQMSAKGLGAVIVAWDGLGVSNPLNKNGTLAHVQEIVNFCKDGWLQHLLYVRFEKDINIDASSFIFAGHSSGGQMAVETALANVKITKGLFLMDPVDRDPYGYLFLI
jgi:hypothetical protein